MFFFAKNNVHMFEVVRWWWWWSPDDRSVRLHD